MADIHISSRQQPIRLAYKCCGISCLYNVFFPEHYSGFQLEPKWVYVLDFRSVHHQKKFRHFSYVFSLSESPRQLSLKYRFFEAPRSRHIFLDAPNLPLPSFYSDLQASILAWISSKFEVHRHSFSRMFLSIEYYRHPVAYGNTVLTNSCQNSTQWSSHC